MKNQIETKLAHEIAVASLDILPNPVFVKDADLVYIWVNKAFEDLFKIKCEDIVGNLDTDFFQDRQAVQCNGGDLRVLETGNMDEAYETMFDENTNPREMITRKNRFILSDGSKYLIGDMHDITEVVHANRELKKNKALLEDQAVVLRNMANTDSLTDCLNRRALFEIASKELSHYKSSVATLILDIDFFKKVNDTYGHVAGDAALVHFVDIVKTQVRATDLVSRFGGEEFVILMIDAPMDEANNVAERIRQKVEASPLHFHGQVIHMTVSIGGAIHEAKQQHIVLDTLLNKADSCLYQAKESGRNQVIITA